MLALAGCSGGSSHHNSGGSSGTAVTVTVDQSSATIQIGEVLTLTATASSGGVVWEVDPATGGTLSASGLTASFTATAAGTYTITATSDADASQSATTTVTVNAPPPVAITIGISPVSETVQAGHHVTLTATVSQGGVTWVAPAAVTLVPSGLTADFSAAAAGTYAVRVRSDDDPTKEATSTIIVTAPPPSTVNDVATNTDNASLQTGASLPITATVDGPGSVSWSTSAGGSLTNTTGNSTDFSAAAPGSYTVTATSDADPSQSTTVPVDVTTTAPAVVNVSLNTVIASITTGGSVSLTATVNGAGGVAWSVSPSGGSVSAASTASGASVTFTSSTPGTYIVTAKSDADPTKTATATITVTAPPPVSVALDVTSQTIQAGNTLALNATVSSSSATVAWSADCGTVSPASGLATTYTAPSAATATTCIVTATATAPGAGSGTAQATISVTPAPPPVVSVSISPTSATVDVGDTEHLTATINGGSGGVVNWTASCGSFSPASGLSTTYTAPASPGPCTVTATSAEDPSKSGTITVTVVAPPAVTISVAPSTTSVAANGTVTLTATVSSGSVTWTADDCGSIGATTGTSITFTAPGAAGTCHVTVTSADDITKSATATITVTAPPPSGNTLTDWQQTGTYSTEYVSSSAGNTVVDTQGWMVFDLPNPPHCMAMYSKMDMGGGSFVETNMIVLTDFTWNLMPTQTPPMYMKMATSAGACSPSGSTPVNKIGSGTDTIAAGTIYAKTLPYDEYDTGTAGLTVRQYLDNSLGWGIYGSEVRNSGTVTTWMVYTDAWNTVHPADAFDTTTRTAGLCEAMTPGCP
jgi:hypothetical protein